MNLRQLSSPVITPNIKEKNRIQILFDEIPEAEVREKLKKRGFKWARTDKAWQRLFNKRSINEVNWLIKDGILEVVTNEKMS